MPRLISALALVLISTAISLAPRSGTHADEAPKPTLKITPGKVIVPTDRMRRIWGELVHLDLKTRTGKFRSEGTDEIMTFSVLPYAELLHHATFGDLQDFRVGERAIFRLHENDKGEWTWLTYIQDEMNFLHGHKEYYHVDAIDSSRSQLVCTDANADLTYVRKKGIAIGTDANTRYWKAGQPAKFADIKVGDKLRTQTHGLGKGDTRIGWEIFLDDESVLNFQAAQKLLHAKRMRAEGLPGYIDGRTENQLQMTLFLEARELTAKLKPGQAVRVAPAGIDRKPTATAVAAKIAQIKGNNITLDLPPSVTAFAPPGLARLWVDDDSRRDK